LTDIRPLLDIVAKALLSIFSEIDAQVKEYLAKILGGKCGEMIDFAGAGRLWGQYYRTDKQGKPCNLKEFGKITPLWATVASI
jgi:hypothetical protein